MKADQLDDEDEQQGEINLMESTVTYDRRIFRQQPTASLTDLLDDATRAPIPEISKHFDVQASAIPLSTEQTSPPYLQRTLTNLEDAVTEESLPPEYEYVHRSSVTHTDETPTVERPAVVRRGSHGQADHREALAQRRQFILSLAKSLLLFGAPSHRIESQLIAISKILECQAGFVHMPGLILITMRSGGTKSTRTHFIRATGRIALTPLHEIHHVYRAVLHNRMGTVEGTQRLKELMRAPAIYSLHVRCFLAFVCASIMCILSFGGSILDMGVSGLCAAFLQYLSLSSVKKSAMYANVHEISVSIIVAFTARGLSAVPGKLFCNSAISSAGVILILPGYIVLTSALELMSKNTFCGSVRMVYAVIYALFLGFSLTIGSDLYFVMDANARHQYYGTTSKNITYTHGSFNLTNGTVVSGVLAVDNLVTDEMLNIIKGCYREPQWPWWRMPASHWTLFFLVPLYSLCSALSNLQQFRSWQMPVMVAFSCCSYLAREAITLVLPGRTDLLAACGAFVIGSLGNIYSRAVGGTAFTSTVVGVMFLVPSAIAKGGGFSQIYHTSAEQYFGGFSLALRMITVASGVTIGLFVSQVAVYALGKKKKGAHFGF